MKKWILLASVLTLSVFGAFAADTPVKIGIVNFKKVVEESKLGKKEEAAFEAMKNQMEKTVEEKEKVLTELANKLNDPDQLDLMSVEAETELKRKFRALSQELSQIQAQYYQTLNQANFKIVQGLSGSVAQASERVAQQQKLDLVMNSETAFFSNKTLDVSNLIVKEMDLMFDQNNKGDTN